MIDHFDGKWLVVCVDNRGNEESLEQWKIYQSFPDEEAEKHQEIRVIDEEGEDYLYPADCFSPVFLIEAVAKSLVTQYSSRRNATMSN